MHIGFNIRAGMFIYGLAFLLGVVLLQQFSVLPSRLLLIIVSVSIGLSGYSIFRFWDRLKPSGSGKYLVQILVILVLIFSGFLASTFTGEQALSQRLDEDFVGKNIIVRGFVTTVPRSTGTAQRFEFVVESHHLGDDDSVSNELKRIKFPEKIRLSWYYGAKVNADEQWQFEVRLKPPHGFINPGGFDYEAWLFQQGIHATGYIRKSDVNQRLEVASNWSINRFRQSLGLKIGQLDIASFLYQGQDAISTLPLIKALAIGDKSSISQQQWKVLTHTGTSHLMAISGLHIGLAALFANILVRRFVPAGLLKYIPAQHLALIAGVITAVLYALVAGLSIPTQRALIMLLVLSVLLLLRRNHRPLDALGFALLVILLIDPLAVLSIGFWFSFSAVAVIFISITSEQKNEKTSLWLKLKAILHRWMRLQLIISLFLLPLSLFMFQQVSLVSPLANLLLIPYVSFLVVPLVLLAILFSFIASGLSDALFQLAATLLDLIWPSLSWLSSQSFALWQYGDLGIIRLLLASCSLLLFYFSKQISEKIIRKESQYFTTLSLLRGLALVIFLSCFLSFFVGIFGSTATKLKREEIKLTVLDVGQGSSAVIQTKNHLLVFDAGARFSDRLDTGKNIIIPFLRTEKREVIDTLVVSHGDADHIGGAQSLLDEYPDIKLIGQDISKLKANNMLLRHTQLCFSGVEWQWDGVDFKFLSPQNSLFQSEDKETRNNHSCVLHVSSSLGSILLTGDIESEIEQQLLEKYRTQLASDILIVPHHGSNTSSTKQFITAVSPNLSIISAGYNNRYHLPNSKVLARYARHISVPGHRVLQTHSSGAISVILKGDDVIEFQQFRERSRKYWHHNVKN